MNTKKLTLLSGLLLFTFACSKENATQPPEPPKSSTTTTENTPVPTAPPKTPISDIEVTLDLDNFGEPFGDLFRSLNLDAGKQMNDDADYDRIERLMCPDPTNCTPGPVRYWDKINVGRFSLEQSIANHGVIQELHTRGFPIYWSMMGVPAFLHSSCSGCLINEDDDTTHLLRELAVDASDPRNPFGIDIDCQCEDDIWWSGPPSLDPVGGISWLQYVEETTTELLTIFDSETPNLRIGIWNEPDQIWWEENQTQFVNMWCATAQTVRQVLGDRTDILIGGPDVSSWAHSIGGADTPLLQAIQTACGDNPPYDFLTYHHYSEPGKFLFENTVETVRSWGSQPDLPIGIGEYASSLGHGAEATTPCDQSVIAAQDGDTPIATGLDPSAVLCDHRGAVEDIALAATMAAQDHDRLYRFEVWDWGTTDMINSRMGLLTINNLPKPTATSFWMLSHLQGNRVAVINQLDGPFPYHLIASLNGDKLVLLVAAQNRTVTEQFARGLLSQGFEFAKEVAPVLAECPAFQLEDVEASISTMAIANQSAEQIIADCSTINPSLAEALAKALAYAAPRVGHVGETFNLTIHAPGWDGAVTRHRIDAYHNTFAEAYRRWPNEEFVNETFDYQSAEEVLWEYLTSPLDEIKATNGQLTFEVRPDSATMLSSEIQ